MVSSRTTQAWTGRGHLARSAQTESGQTKVYEYVYGADATRVSVTSDGRRTEFLIDPNNFTGYSQTLRETTRDVATGSFIEAIDYTFGQARLAQTRTPFTDGVAGAPETLTFTADAHGSTRLLTGHVGEFVEAYAYAAYGELLALTNATNQLVAHANAPINAASAKTSALYAGEQWDSGAAAYYNRARRYDPSSGRFLGLDPFAGNKMNPQSLHRYGYVHSDPIGGADPLGLYLIAIDGTGTEDWLTNPRNPQKLPNGRWLSHVRNFAREYKGVADYQFGVGAQMTGADAVAIENRAYNNLQRRWRTVPGAAGEPIDIIGWSRGGNSAMRLARRLKRDGLQLPDGTRMKPVPVRFMGLYDPVDMTVADGDYGYDGSKFQISSNVQNVFAVQGKQDSPDYSGVDYDLDSPVYYHWPRMPLSVQNGSSTVLTRRYKNITHGAIGGTPGYSPDPSLRGIYNYTLDQGGSQATDHSLRHAAMVLGVPIGLVSNYGFPAQQSDLPPIGPSTWSSWRHGWGVWFGSVAQPASDLVVNVTTSPNAKVNNFVNSFIY